MKEILLRRANAYSLNPIPGGVFPEVTLAVLESVLPRMQVVFYDMRWPYDSGIPRTTPVKPLGAQEFVLTYRFETARFSLKDLGGFDFKIKLDNMYGYLKELAEQKCAKEFRRIKKDGKLFSIRIPEGQSPYGKWSIVSLGNKAFKFQCSVRLVYYAEMSSRPQPTNTTLSKAAWIGVLSDIFQTDISEVIDSIDLIPEALDAVSATLDARQVVALEARYGMRMSYKDAGRFIRNKRNANPASHQTARLVTRTAIRRLAGPRRLRAIKDAIVAPWNIPKDGYYRPWYIGT